MSQWTIWTKTLNKSISTYVSWVLARNDQWSEPDTKLKLRNHQIIQRNNFHRFNILIKRFYPITVKFPCLQPPYVSVPFLRKPLLKYKYKITWFNIYFIGGTNQVLKEKKREANYSSNVFSEGERWWYYIQNAQFKQALFYSHTYARRFSR